MTRPIESLDDLFADAMEAERTNPTRPVMKAAKPEAPKPLRFSDKYALPENWVAGVGVALIHKETSTLLGNFQEFTHKTERTARKLVRVEEPIQILHTEYVSGPQWLADKPPIPTPERWTSERVLLLPDLALHSLGVHAEAVEVKVCMMHGYMTRVELNAHTTFISPDAKTVITLPTGVNVLEAMNLDAKIALRKELAV